MFAICRQASGLSMPWFLEDQNLTTDWFKMFSDPQYSMLPYSCRCTICTQLQVQMRAVLSLLCREVNNHRWLVLTSRGLQSKQWILYSRIQRVLSYLVLHWVQEVHKIGKLPYDAVGLVEPPHFSSRGNLKSPRNSSRGLERFSF